MSPSNEYTDLSHVRLAFNPLTDEDKRWKEIFEDEYARVVCVGYRLSHIFAQGEVSKLMDESLKISREIREGKLVLETEPFKKRLQTMAGVVHGQFASSSIINLNKGGLFVDYLLQYLKGEKPFGYEIMPS